MARVFLWIIWVLLDARRIYSKWSLSDSLSWLDIIERRAAKITAIFYGWWSIPFFRTHGCDHSCNYMSESMRKPSRGERLLSYTSYLACGRPLSFPVADSGFYRRGAGGGGTCKSEKHQYGNRDLQNPFGSTQRSNGTRRGYIFVFSMWTYSKQECVLSGGGGRGTCPNAFTWTCIIHRARTDSIKKHLQGALLVKTVFRMITSWHIH